MIESTIGRQEADQQKVDKQYVRDVFEKGIRSATDEELDQCLRVLCGMFNPRADVIWDTQAPLLCNAALAEQQRRFVANLDRSNSFTQKVMLWLTVLATVVGIIQIVMAK